MWYPRIISDGPPSPLYDFCMVLWKRMLVYADRVWPAIHLIEQKPRLRQEARSRLAKWLSALCHWPRCSKELIAERWQTRSGMVESCQHDLPSLFHSLQGSYNRTQCGQDQVYTVMTNYTLTRVLTLCPGVWHERMWRALRKREVLKDYGCMKSFPIDHERDITNRAGMKRSLFLAEAVWKLGLHWQVPILQQGSAKFHDIISAGYICV